MHVTLPIILQQIHVKRDNIKEYFQDKTMSTQHKIILSTTVKPC